MEINITKFFNEACPKDYSASVAEIGNNAGAYTYQAAMDDSEEYLMLATDEQQEAFREWVAEFGAWEGAEINAWTVQEMNALFIQFVSAEMREYDMSPENNNEDFWYDYEHSENAGRIFKSQLDNNIYFDISI